MPGDVRLLVNPSAGGGRAGRASEADEAELRRLGLNVAVSHTRDLDHARHLAAETAAAGEIAACLSGDGLVGVVADVLRTRPGSTLAVLPGGRGNDLARVLGIPEDPVAACGVVADGVPRPMDVGEVLAPGAESGTAFVGIASVGFDSDANRIANEAPSWLGGLVYAYGALRALAAWRAARFEIVLAPSGERRAFTGYSVAAANSRAYGGGMMLAPDAMLDDGQLDVLTISEVSRMRFLANLPKVFKGEHVREPSVEVLRAAELTVTADRPFTMYADGDPIGTLPLRVRALPGAVSILTPAEAPAHPAFGAAGPAAAAATAGA